MNDDKGSGDGSPGSHNGGNSMFGHMATMVAICVGALLLLILLPTFGVALGPGALLGVLAVMIVLHVRFMRHG